MPITREGEGRLRIDDLQLQLPIAMLTPLLPTLPVTLAGDLVCHGKLAVDRVILRPYDPDLTCDWHQAAAVMGETPQQLGDFTATLRGDGKAWQWSRCCGGLCKVTSDGALDPQNAALQAWQLDGALTVSAGKWPLAAMIAGVVGGQSRKVVGTVGAPSIQ